MTVGLGGVPYRIKGSSLTRVAAPSAVLLTTDEVKRHVPGADDFTDDDTQFDDLIAAATSHLDGPFGIMGRALVTQEWALTLPSAPQIDYVSLPLPIVQSITSIEYFDIDNGSQIFAAENYRLVSGSDSAIVELTDDAVWPLVALRADAITITFVTGYGDVAADVPAAIRRAAQMMVAHWYDGGDGIPASVAMLVANYRTAGGRV